MTNIDYWEELSGQYQEKYAQPSTILEHEKRNRLDSAYKLAATPEAGTILEIGVGAGILLATIPPDLPDRIIGFDFSRDMIDIAAQNADVVEFIQGEASRLPFESDSVDLVFCLGVVGHMNPEDACQLYSELDRIVSDNGQVVFSFANAQSPFRRLRSIHAKYVRSAEPDYHSFEPDEVVNAFKSFGFSIDATRYHTFSSALWNYRPNQFLYEILENHFTEIDLLSGLAMTWVISARRTT